jgi:hypothetical protein
VIVDRPFGARIRASPLYRSPREDDTMMHEQGFGWMGTLGFGHGWIGLLILVLLILGIAALIKYLFSNR